MKKIKTLCKSTTTLDLQTVILVLSDLLIWSLFTSIYLVVFILFSLFYIGQITYKLIVKT